MKLLGNTKADKHEFYFGSKWGMGGNFHMTRDLSRLR